MLNVARQSVLGGSERTHSPTKDTPPCDFRGVRRLQGNDPRGGVGPSGISKISENSLTPGHR